MHIIVHACVVQINILYPPEWYYMLVPEVDLYATMSFSMCSISGLEVALIGKIMQEMVMVG